MSDEGEIVALRSKPYPTDANSEAAWAKFHDHEHQWVMVWSTCRVYCEVNGCPASVKGFRWEQEDE